MAEETIIIRAWNDYWTQAGAVYELVYLTPAPDRCKNDRAAFDQLVQRSGVALAHSVLLLGPLGGKLSGTNATVPAGSMKRITDRVISFWIVTTKAGVLGTMLATTLKPCGARAESDYTLSVVHRHRASTSGLAMLAAKASDSVTDRAGSTVSLGEVPSLFADDVGDLAAGTAELAGDVAKKATFPLLEVLAPLVVPVLIGIGVYVYAARRLA